MTTAQRTWSTNHIENEAAYSAAIKRNIIQNAQKTWRINTHRAEEIEETIQDGRVFDLDEGTVVYKENFIGSMAHAFDTYGKLTEKQSAAVLKGIDARQVKLEQWAQQRAERDAASEWIGYIGKRIELTLTVNHVVTLCGNYGVTFINLCRDNFDNAVVYKGSNDLKFHGDKVTVKATIKAHETRDGVKQTIIARPKIID
ncbi:hypothetical protein [Shewanella sp.]|jgi:hypothetical protein|uniref:hypothetical protein n=1 Tax=Shewanella sp. TaxID=50422 RepID=UPI0040472A97